MTFQHESGRKAKPWREQPSGAACCSVRSITRHVFCKCRCPCEGEQEPALNQSLCNEKIYVIIIFTSGWLFWLTIVSVYLTEWLYIMAKKLCITSGSNYLQAARCGADVIGGVGQFKTRHLCATLIYIGLFKLQLHVFFYAHKSCYLESNLNGVPSRMK